MIRKAILLGFALSAGAASASTSALEVDAVFADHMVLQQGKPIPVRGSAAPGAAVRVAFNGAIARSRADGGGRWVAIVPAQAGGAMGTLSISAEGSEGVTFKDVAVGEVWLCSGQSNMDLPVAQAANPQRTAREAEGQPIRLLKIRRTAAASPAAHFAAEIPWSVADETTVSAFSAACWHMARGMRARGVTVPIGLVHAAWGGSTIEDWMSPAALRAAGVAEQDLALLRDYAAGPAETVAKAVVRTDQWAAANDPASSPASGWFGADVDDSDWSTIQVPGQWERSGVEELRAYDGLVWFRRSFELTAAEAAAGGMLNLGRIDERDRVWINGQPVGATMSTEIARSYRVPAGVLREGANTVAVRILDEMGSGGFSSPASALAMEIAAGRSIALAGAWRYRLGASEKDWRTTPPFLPWSAPRGLGMAWSGMIAPLKDFPLGGIAWYQGESNTARASTYAKLLENWRADWRRQFRDPRLPVVIVQLPGYGPRTTRPTDAAWAQLREAQRRTAQADPRTGLAVAIDLGVSTDIHPAHKDVLGERMAMEAMRVAYDASVPLAPSPIAARRMAHGVVVQFAGAADGLTNHGTAAPTAFEWCDAQKACEFASAVVDGSSVVVKAPPQAAFVRYAWQGFPPVSLYGSSGLPVVPFEIPVAR